MTRRRILHIITRLDRGGSAENTLLSAAGLDPDQWDVTIAVGPTTQDPGPTLQRARERGVRFVDVPSLVRAPDPWKDLQALRQLRHLLRQGWDVVHTHTSKAGILGRWAARGLGVPVVHTPHGHVFYGYYGSIVTRAFVTAERRAARWCDRLVALTVADRQDHERFGVGETGQWVVIHSGVDFSGLDRSERSRDEVRADLGIEADRPVVGTLGRLTAIKGQADLIDAVSFLQAEPLPHLLLIGDGEEQGALRARAEQVGLQDRTLLCGWRTDIGDLLRAIDVFVLPSHNEGMGRALVEAMYLGLPVIATDVGGIPELIEDGVQGLLVPPRAPAALADAIARMLSDTELRHRVGDQAALRARDYGADRMVERLVELYDSLTIATPAVSTEARRLA